MRADEDEQCALYLRNVLQGRQPDREAVRTLVLAGNESQKFGDPAQPHFHPEDRNLALMIDGVIDGECRAKLLALLLPRPQ